MILLNFNYVKPKRLGYIALEKKIICYLGIILKPMEILIIVFIVILDWAIIYDSNINDT